MKIGMEPDPVEDLDRRLERAVAAAVKARFGDGDDSGHAFDEVHRLSQQRLNLSNRSIPQPF